MTSPRSVHPDDARDFGRLRVFGISSAFSKLNWTIILTVALAILSAWAVFNWIQTVERISDFYTPVPFSDYWRVPSYLNAYRHLDLGAFWRQHNEHRIVFPEIFFAIDLTLLHGRQLLPLALSFLCYVGVWLGIVAAISSERRVSSAVRGVALLLAAVVIGWKGSAVVLANAFLLVWTLMQVAVIWALFLVSHFKKKQQTPYLITAIVLGVIASYSCAIGLLLWPVLIAGAFVLHLGRRPLFILICAAAVSIGAYFINYRFPKTLHIGELSLHPIYSVQFIATYISMPFAGIKGPHFGIYVGLASLIIIVILGIIAIKNKFIESTAGVVLFGYYCFVLISALATCAARMDPRDSWFGQARADRYVTLPLTNWAVLVALCLLISAKFHPRLPATAGIGIIVSALLLVGFVKLRWWLQEQNDDYAKAQTAALSIMDGVDDSNLIHYLFRDAGFVDALLPELRHGQQSIFYKEYSKWIGKPAMELGPVLDEPEHGEITDTYPVCSGIEVIGWAEGPAHSRASRWIGLVSEAGQLVGFGRQLPTGLPRDLDISGTPPPLAWVGFVNLQFHVSSFSAYSITKRGLVPLGSAMSIPAPESTSRQPLQSIMASQWQGARGY